MLPKCFQCRGRKINNCIGENFVFGSGCMLNQTPAIQLDKPALQQLYAYWDDKRAGRPYPTREDIDPLELKFILGCLLLLDVERKRLEEHTSELQSLMSSSYAVFRLKTTTITHLNDRQPPHLTYIHSFTSYM